jgi:hypothetical protein
MKLSPILFLLGFGLGLGFGFDRNVTFADAALVPPIPAHIEQHDVVVDLAIAANKTEPVGVVINNVTERNPQCNACEYLANGFNQTILHNPKVMAIVTADIEKACSFLPESVQSMCKDAAQTVTPLIIDHIGDFIANDGCRDLGVCH